MLVVKRVPKAEDMVSTLISRGFKCVERVGYWECSKRINELQDLKYIIFLAC